MIHGSTDYLADRYLDKVREAYLLEKGERAAELEGRRLAFKDASGLHPVSLVTGQYREVLRSLIVALDLDPMYDPIEVLYVDHFELRAVARADAELEHTRAIVAEAFEEHARAEEARSPGLAEARAKAAAEPPAF